MDFHSRDDVMYLHILLMSYPRPPRHALAHYGTPIVVSLRRETIPSRARPLKPNIPLAGSRYHAPAAVPCRSESPHPPGSPRGAGPVNPAAAGNPTRP